MASESERVQHEQRDRDLIQEAQLAPGSHDFISRRAFATLIVNLKNAMASQSEAAAQLGKRVERLNTWLLWITVAIGVMTLVQAAAAAVTLWKTWR